MLEMPVKLGTDTNKRSRYRLEAVAKSERMLEMPAIPGPFLIAKRTEDSFW